MENTTPTTGPIPPPPRFGLDTDIDPSCEQDVDLADDEDELEAAALARATDPEGAEFLGEHPTLIDYMRSQLEPEIARGCHWLLDCLDWSEVRARFESDGSRLMIEHGHVYRLALGLLLLTITASGCTFNARGIASETGGESTGTTGPCWDCDPYPDARERLTDASHGGGDEPGTSTGADPEPGTSSGTGEGAEPGASTSTSSGSSGTSTSGTSTGEQNGSSTGADAGESSTGGGGVIPQGEFCMAFGECAPSKDAPNAKPECFNGSCELFCKTTADCPQAQVCTFIEGWNYWTCEEP